MPPALSIVIPVYNEERTLRTLLVRVQHACPEAQIICVNDGSKDASLAIMQQMARSQDRVVDKQNGGKGSAVRAGYEHAEGDYVIVQDADLEYSPEEIPSVLEAAQAKDADAVFGSRRLKQQKQYVHFLFFIGGTMLTWTCNLLYGTRLTDQPTCYKLVRRKILQTFNLRENDFRFDPELTVMLARAGVKIYEVPISYAPRSIAEGKKINWKDWFKWMWVFLLLRFMPRSRLYTRESIEY